MYKRKIKLFVTNSVYLLGSLDCKLAMPDTKQVLLDFPLSGKVVSIFRKI